mmetsp:Transcript_21222/g.52579  ORF Transcript_21222/g.52579 Transcript_21222/m.52579 type:complete len:742 (+) Transcript_21222:219-2444(+)
MAVVLWPTLLVTPKMWKGVCCFTCLVFLLRSSTCQASGEDYKGISGKTARSGVESKFASGHMSIANMTCKVFEQPLNHFVPRGRSPIYEERYCTYDGFAVSRGEITDGVDKSPIFFYTGNESPLEQYINQTGLMWELAPKFGARIVFAEHRYEGESLPPKTLSVDCLSYASTIQALADYARILEEELNPNNVAPVIVFGGSYGGMLSAWMRMKYPHLVAGAIAASAPIGAFPQPANLKIDYSARVLAQGMDRPYPPTAALGHGEGQGKELAMQRKGRRLQGTRATIPLKVEEVKPQSSEEWNAHSTKNHCSDNLLAAWPLIAWLAQQDDEQSANLLQESFSMCDPLPYKNGDPLLRWAQGVWFDLAEGSFPYPSSYIPFALLHKNVKLPPWPTQDACWKSSQLHKDWGVRFDGSKEDVNYTIDYGNSGIRLKVDWGSVKLLDENSGRNVFNSSAPEDSTDIVGLLTSVKDAVSIWYNITKDVQCYNISQTAPNSKTMSHPRDQRTLSFLMSSFSKSSEDVIAEFHDSSSETKRHDYLGFDPAKQCHEAMVEQGSWGMLCCNDEMNLVITEARGMGKDFFWPPTHPRNVRSYQDMISNATFGSCPDPYGIYGYSREPYEPMSKRLDTYYGGISMKGHSNIVFSNGLLDPWSAGGVYTDNRTPNFLQESFLYDKASIQNITENDVVALIMPFGGHHTDLMYSSDSDPKCVTEGRNVEQAFISRWIRDRQGDHHSRSYSNTVGE